MLYHSFKISARFKCLEKGWGRKNMSWQKLLTHCSLFISPDHSGKGYGSVREEAVKLFNCLQQLESAREPVPIIQGVLQTCLDLRPLRDEVYCQLVKQTSYTPSPNTAAHLRYWQLLTCMSCTFLPGPIVLKYLRFHLKRWDATIEPRLRSNAACWEVRCSALYLPCSISLQYYCNEILFSSSKAVLTSDRFKIVVLLLQQHSDRIFFTFN